MHTLAWPMFDRSQLNASGALSLRQHQRHWMHTWHCMMAVSSMWRTFVHSSLCKMGWKEGRHKERWCLLTLSLKAQHELLEKSFQVDRVFLFFFFPVDIILSIPKFRWHSRIWMRTLGWAIRGNQGGKEPHRWWYLVADMAKTSGRRRLPHIFLTSSESPPAPVYLRCI